MTDIVERFNPCATEECKSRCDNFGAYCEEICIDEIESLRQQLDDLKAEMKMDAEGPDWIQRAMQAEAREDVLKEQLAECHGKVPQTRQHLQQ